jgi:putative spermidine/putrescine transport system substrate-binding protein/spermidine/putrescine transport system substrate-binding protein
MKRNGKRFALTLALLVMAVVALSAQDKPVLSIMCFQGYAEDSWVKPFEEKYNCTVKIAYAGAVDEMFSKVKAAPADYNIVSIDPGRITMYKSAGLLQPVTTGKLANYAQMGAFFRNHPYNKLLGGGGIYHIPIVWGTQTITVNTDKVPAAQLAKYVDAKKGTISIKVLTAPEFKGKTAFFDESTNVVSIAGIEIGAKDPFNFKADEWKKVQDKLYAWKKNARTFTTGLDSEFSVLSSEDALFVLGGNDALLNLKLEEAGIRQSFKQFAMTEGTIAWIDGWVITKPTSGASLDLAHKYIDTMIGAQVQTKLAELVGFGVVNPAGSGGFSPVIKDSTWWYQDIKTFPSRLEIMIPEEDANRRVELWNKVKAMP